MGPTCLLVGVVCDVASVAALRNVTRVLFCLGAGELSAAPIIAETVLLDGAPAPTAVVLAKDFQRVGLTFVVHSCNSLRALVLFWFGLRAMANPSAVKVMLSARCTGSPRRVVKVEAR